MTWVSVRILLWSVALAILPGSVRAGQPARPNHEELTLCARVGLLQSTRGQPVAFGRHLLPPLWSIRRDVRFQVCTPDGRARHGVFSFEVAIEPVTPDIGAAGPASYSVTTDEQGRFTGMYGAGSRVEGPAWPEGFTSVELHHFRLNGGTVATFVLEREAQDIRFYRR